MGNGQKQSSAANTKQELSDGLRRDRVRSGREGLYARLELEAQELGVPNLVCIKRSSEVARHWAGRIREEFCREDIRGVGVKVMPKGFDGHLRFVVYLSRKHRPALSLARNLVR